MPELAVLAAGVGKRLFPITCITPKPLVPLTGRISNVLSILDKFTSSGLFRKAYIVLGYVSIPFAEYLRRAFGKDNRVSVIVADRLRGTAGQLCEIISYVNEDLLVVNGDIFMDDTFVGNLLQVVSELCTREDFDLCIITYPLRVKYGVVESEEERFIKWVEKPVLNIVTGIYYLKKRILTVLRDLCRLVKYLDMNVLVNLLIERARNVIVKSVEGIFLDLGTIDDYSRVVGMLSEVNISMS